MAKQPVSSTAFSSGGLSELKYRLLFVALGIFIFRVGAHIPVPGLDPVRLASIFNQHQNNILGLLNMFSGGALLHFTIFAIGIMPYISASIILQLFTVVSPKLEQLKKEGESGRRKITQYTRYATFFIASFQGLGFSKWLMANGAVIISTTFFSFLPDFAIKLVPC